MWIKLSSCVYTLLYFFFWFDYSFFSIIFYFSLTPSAYSLLFSCFERMFMCVCVAYAHTTCSLFCMSFNGNFHWLQECGKFYANLLFFCYLDIGICINVIIVWKFDINFIPQWTMYENVCLELAHTQRAHVRSEGFWYFIFRLLLSVSTHFFIFWSREEPWDWETRECLCMWDGWMAVDSETVKKKDSYEKNAPKLTHFSSESFSYPTTTSVSSHIYIRVIEKERKRLKEHS